MYSCRLERPKKIQTDAKKKKLINDTFQIQFTFNTRYGAPDGSAYPSLPSPLDAELDVVHFVYILYSTGFPGCILDFTFLFVALFSLGLFKSLKLINRIDS